MECFCFSCLFCSFQTLVFQRPRYLLWWGVCYLCFTLPRRGPQSISLKNPLESEIWARISQSKGYFQADLTSLDSQFHFIYDILRSPYCLTKTMVITYTYFFLNFIEHLVDFLQVIPEKFLPDSLITLSAILPEPEINNKFKNIQ